jgi:polyferredoxin
MNRFRKYLIYSTIILSFGALPSVVVQFFTHEPTDRYIHIKNFRYGKKPSVIRCNRGDKLHLTFSTEDTGHSFFLEEFDVDAKVSPSREEVEVFRTSDPSSKPFRTKELIIVAKHKGISNFLVSKSNYRCHVWCGPMHAFEQGKLIILPNTLLIFSLGCLIGIIFLWLREILIDQFSYTKAKASRSGYKDLLKSPVLRKLIISRWPQFILTLLAMLMIYIVILTSIFGTQMSGRNLGVLMMWAIWLFLLVAILTPFMGRIWCTICPLPFFGDLIQRKSFITPLSGNTKGYNNKFSGFFLKWPEWLRNSWVKLFFFMILATFSTTLVAKPKVSGFTLLILLLLPTVMSVIWELRTFCRYVCPVSVFIGPYSRVSTFSVRNKSQQVCDRCKPVYCRQGSKTGWACPYGINVGEMNENTDCGICLECMRSCMYNNVSLFRRPFGTELGTRNLSEAWLTLAVFTLSIVYSILYEGHWAVVRDYVNILDKKNWDLFGLYAVMVWTITLLVVPGIIYLLSYTGARLSGIKAGIRDVFLASAGTTLPLGLMLWIAFVIPMLFVNITFIIQSASDPFGWGWDFFGTANIPWHQFMPKLVPWLQAGLVLTGVHFSLRNLKNTWQNYQLNSKDLLKMLMPMSLFIIGIAVIMIFFYTN